MNLNPREGECWSPGDNQMGHLLLHFPVCILKSGCRKHSTSRNLLNIWSEGLFFSLSLKHQRQTEISISKSCFLYLENMLRIWTLPTLHPGLRPVTPHLVAMTISYTGFPSSTWFPTVCSYHCSLHHPFKRKPDLVSPSLRTLQWLILFRMKPKAS